MELLPLKKILEMSKDKLKETFIPIKCAMAKKQAEIEEIKIDEEIMALKMKTQDLFLQDKICFPDIICNLDEIALLERKKDQYSGLIKQLFPK